MFVSYSHKDVRWLKRLRVHLRPLQREARITVWDDTTILSGDEWAATIQKEIDSARVAILLLSADYLASDFIMQKELPPLLEASRASTCRIIPVIVSPCRFKDSALWHLQAANDPNRPLSGMTKAQQEAVFVKLIQEVDILIRQQDDVSLTLRQQSELTRLAVVEPPADGPNHSLPEKEAGTKFVENELPHLVSRLSGKGKAFSAIFIDLDNLSQINKRFSRDVGDDVLDIVYELIRRRSAARYYGRCGDDTFYAVLFDSHRVEHFCERLKEDVASYRWGRIAPNLRVTCTLGYARHKENESATDFLRRSIHGMLEGGKKAGGNVVQEGPRHLPGGGTVPTSFQRVKYHSGPLSLRDYFS